MLLNKHYTFNFFGLKIKLKNHKYYNDVFAEYEKIVDEIKNRKEKIKVAFLVSSLSMFAAKPLFEKMLNNSKFKVSLILLPDFRFGEDNARKNFLKIKEELSEYSDITYYVPFEEEKDNINLKEIADIAVFSIPYDICREKYNLENIISLNILPALVNYGFFRSKYDRELIASSKYSLFWKIFVETEQNLEEYKKYQKVKAKNTVLTGYCKMDDYANYLRKEEKKTIIIAPHHSLDGGYNDKLSLSNFYKYSDLFLKLPDVYPDIKFIFRPHPALFTLLAQDSYWGQQKVDKYLQKMVSKPNVEYSTKGDYFEEFANSDAIIQDCGSYLVEYFYTKKPQCYMLKSQKDISKKFTELGKNCLKHSYITYEEQDIVDFINDVVINKKDLKKEQREKFAYEVVMLNYPCASNKAIEYLERVLC